MGSRWALYLYMEAPESQSNLNLQSQMHDQQPQDPGGAVELHLPSRQGTTFSPASLFRSGMVWYSGTHYTPIKYQLPNNGRNFQLHPNTEVDGRRPNSRPMTTGCSPGLGCFSSEETPSWWESPEALFTCGLAVATPD